MKKISLLAATVIVLLVTSCGQDKTVRPVTDPTIVKALASVNIDSVKTYIDELVALNRWWRKYYTLWERREAAMIGLPLFRN